MPMDLKIGDRFYGGSYSGPRYYMMRARLNWDRGCYYLEADLTKAQEKQLAKLLGEKKKWMAGKKYIEKITSRNFETETGYENPFDPDWMPDFGPESQARRKMWLERAGLSFPN